VANDPANPVGTPGTTPVSRWKIVGAILACSVLATVLILVVYVFRVPTAIQVAVSVTASIAGAIILYRAFPGIVTTVVPIVGMTIALVGLVWVHPPASEGSQSSKTNTRTITLHDLPKPCPNTQRPIGMAPANSPVPQGVLSSTRGVGDANIDNVIAPDGTANIHQREIVCLRVLKYPTDGRKLWLMIRIRFLNGNGSNELFFVAGALSDPFPGRYSVYIDRSCSAQALHTLFIMSAPASATMSLWKLYNLRIDDIRSGCNPQANGEMHRPPSGYYILQDQVDVFGIINPRIQHSSSQR
jgi:hypothetical protein